MIIGHNFCLQMLIIHRKCEVIEALLAKLSGKVLFTNHDLSQAYTYQQKELKKLFTVINTCTVHHWLFYSLVCQIGISSTPV